MICVWIDRIKLTCGQSTLGQILCRAMLLVNHVTDSEGGPNLVITL